MLNNLKEWFGQLSATARTSFLIGCGVIVVLFCGLLYWAFATDYQVLFADLDPQDGHAIITELDRMKVPYRLDEAGKTILVEKDQVYKTRLKLMGKGVNLKGTVGFEIFNESDFGMTDFAQRINYQRALQGEITRTIMGLEEVQSARVHLVMPESGLLKKEDSQAKASITVTNKPGSTLNHEQVLGIQRLVAAAIPQIDPTAVTVLDNRGVALSKNTPKSDEAQGADLEGKLAIKQQTEDYFVKKVARILDQSFGPGQAIVSVDATLNHDLLKVTREDILPAPNKNGDAEGAVVRKKKSSKSSGKGKKSKSSVTQSTQADGNEDSSESVEQINDEVEYQHGKKIEQLIANPGSLKRLSVGVILPNNVDPEKIEMLTKVISMSVGLNAERGDAIAVYALNQYLGGSATNSATSSTVNGINAANGATTRAASQPALAQPIGKSSHANKDAKNEHTNQTIFYLLIALAIALGLAGIVMLFSRRSTSSAARLNDYERDKVLQELQSWLNESSPRPSTARSTQQAL